MWYENEWMWYENECDMKTFILQMWYENDECDMKTSECDMKTMWMWYENARERAQKAFENQYVLQVESCKAFEN